MGEAAGDVTAVLPLGDTPDVTAVLPAQGMPGEAVTDPAQIRWAHITLPQEAPVPPVGTEDWADKVAAQHADHLVRQLDAFRDGLSSQRDGDTVYGQTAYIPNYEETEALEILTSRFMSAEDLAARALESMSAEDLAERYPELVDASPDDFYLVPDEHIAEIYRDEADGLPTGADFIDESQKGQKLPLHIRVEGGLKERIDMALTSLTNLEQTELIEFERQDLDLSSEVTRSLGHRIIPDVELGTDELQDLLRSSDRLPDLSGTRFRTPGPVEAPRRPRRLIAWGTARAKTRWPSARGAVTTDREREVGSSWADGRETQVMLSDETWSPIASLRRRMGLARDYAEAAGEWVRDNVEVGQEADQSPSIDIDVLTMIERGWDDPVRTEALLLGHVPTGREGGEDVNARRELAADRAVLAQEMTYRVREIEAGFWETFGASLAGLDHSGEDREAYPDIARDPTREQEWRDWIYGTLFRQMDLGEGNSVDMLGLVRDRFAAGNTWGSVEEGLQYVEDVVFERLVALSADRINAERISSGFAPLPQEARDERPSSGPSQTRVMPAVIGSPDDGADPDDRDRPWRSRRR